MSGWMIWRRMVSDVVSHHTDHEQHQNHEKEGYFHSDDEME